MKWRHVIRIGVAEELAAPDAGCRTLASGRSAADVDVAWHRRRGLRIADVVDRLVARTRTDRLASLTSNSAGDPGGDDARLARPAGRARRRTGTAGRRRSDRSRRRPPPRSTVSRIVTSTGSVDGGSSGGQYRPQVLGQRGRVRRSRSGRRPRRSGSARRRPAGSGTGRTTDRASRSGSSKRALSTTVRADADEGPDRVRDLPVELVALARRRCASGSAPSATGRICSSIRAMFRPNGRRRGDDAVERVVADPVDQPRRERRRPSPSPGPAARARAPGARSSRSRRSATRTDDIAVSSPAPGGRR